MKIHTWTERDLEPEQIAGALASASPEEFAAVWFVFSKKCSPAKLVEFAKYMSDPLAGSNKEAKDSLQTLVRYIQGIESAREISREELRSGRTSSRNAL